MQTSLNTSYHFWIGLFLHLLLPIATNAANLQGTVTDTEGQALPFTSVYVQGTSIGTTTNIDGIYQLELPTGQHIIAFQYVGYKLHLDTISIQQTDVTLNVQLAPVSETLNEIVVSVDDEDPAYRIIRNAIKQRKAHKAHLKAFECESYIKGYQYIENLPERIMGQSLEEFRKRLDSTGTGVVYLSESVSTLHRQAPKRKEIMISSKISGEDNGFSWNSAEVMHDFSFYDNQITIGDSKMLSPIAATALGSYKYELINAYPSDKGRFIYKIKVIPRNPLSQTFRGYIYIWDETWAIHSTELSTSGKAANIAVLDSIHFKQIHIELEDSVYVLFSQDIRFVIDIFGIQIDGQFLGIFKNYNLHPNFPERFFSNEIFTVTDSANLRTEAYWDSIRPVPLQAKELEDYRQKDSLQRIWQSKAYLDSLDKKNNKFKAIDLISGYTFTNTYKKFNWGITSPINTIQFNTVQGIYGDIGAFVEKGYGEGEDWTAWWRIMGRIQYGWPENQLRGRLRLKTKLNDTNDLQFVLEGGKVAIDFNEQRPLSPVLNTTYTLLSKQNFQKLYDKTFVHFNYTQRVLNGWLMRLDATYAYRQPLTNSTDYSWRPRLDRDYFSNQPLDFDNPPMVDTPSFNAHHALFFDLTWRFRIGQKYISYPNRRFHMWSNWPDLWIHYKKAIPIAPNAPDFDYLAIALRKEEWEVGTVGFFSFNAVGGLFIRKPNAYFVDYRHFNGNQRHFTRSDYLYIFQCLPYYAYSTDNWFAELHLQHNFNGFLWKKLPLIKHLGFEWVMGYNLLVVPHQDPYMEFVLGLDRIGWGLFRFLRVNGVMTYIPNQPVQLGFTMGFSFSL